jgi:hypothetical protein
MVNLYGFYKANLEHHLMIVQLEYYLDSILVREVIQAYH